MAGADRALTNLKRRRTAIANNMLHSAPCLPCCPAAHSQTVSKPSRKAFPGEGKRYQKQGHGRRHVRRPCGFLRLGRGELARPGGVEPPACRLGAQTRRLMPALSLPALDQSRPCFASGGGRDGDHCLSVGETGTSPPPMSCETRARKKGRVSNRSGSSEKKRLPESTSV